MNSFSYARPANLDDAATLVAPGKSKYKLPVLKAGGIDLVDHLKEGLVEPDLIVSIRGARTKARATGDAVRESGGGLHIEANATLTDLDQSDAARRLAPALAQAAASAASPQVRNVASAAGNLLQRPRCWYYRHSQFDCLKKGGSTCYAVDGENRYHAILGGGPCHIVHPSNLAPALMIADGVVHLIGGARASVPIADLYHLPDKGVKDEHNLKPGEVITHITCAAAPRSGFYAIKEKQSFDWPIAAACAAVELDGDTIKSARICAAAVAPIPWMLPNVADALKGVSLNDDAKLRAACALASDGAKPMTDNAYKVKLLPVAVRRAVLIAAGRKATEEAEA